MGETTWVEGWQGGDGCGAPVYPHDGAATDYTYVYDADAGTITLNGVGAHLGLPKVHNGGELSSVLLKLQESKALPTILLKWKLKE